MKKNILVLVGCCAVTLLQAQTQFYSTVKIEFEKTISVRQWYKELESDWYEQIKDHIPETVLSYCDFIGDSTRSIYKPGREVPLDPRTWYRPVADKNVVYTDFKKEETISQKPVYEETFLVTDSLLRIKWRITPDIRNIAGFDCRKAIGIINDSISVFAFYTDELMISGGPEAIHGLPGMILGVGIPRLHCTWFATKVEVLNVNMNSVIPATKGKKVNRETMIRALDKVLKNWGTYGSKMIVNFLI
jgi:GLPGLI family protein